MPYGRHHSAAGTDGVKVIIYRLCSPLLSPNIYHFKFYIFGGRDGKNTISQGFADVQVFNPLTNIWSTSATDATIAPMLEGRGGAGAAVYIRGYFYVFGGETPKPQDVSMYIYEWNIFHTCPHLYTFIYYTHIYILHLFIQQICFDSYKNAYKYRIY